jgi:hypothetical protein
VSADASTPPAAAALAGDDPLSHDPGMATPDEPMGFVSALAALWSDLRGALTERARLVALELRLAGMTLLRLVVYAVIVAILVITAWLGLMGWAVVQFVHLGLSWGWALALGVLINLAIAGWLVRTMVKMIERVGLPAALRSIEGK